MIAPGTEAVRRGRPGRPHAAACLTLLCTAGAALASPPLTLVYETRVRVEVRLLLHDGSGAATEIEEVLTGVSGDRLA
ncbi:MAG: hypothetical protein OEQ13_03460, partial [Acidobacteriota bacterium]|nr:hypothetical protein [Acidobacteriota bacterium]